MSELRKAFINVGQQLSNLIQRVEIKLFLSPAICNNPKSPKNQSILLRETPPHQGI